MYSASTSYLLYLWPTGVSFSLENDICGERKRTKAPSTNAHNGKIQRLAARATGLMFGVPARSTNLPILDLKLNFRIYSQL